MSARRKIFRALRDAGRPLTTIEICKRTKCGAGSVANECCRLEQVGALDRPHGPRRGYRLLASMLPEDRAALVELVRLYGMSEVIDQVEHMCSPHRRGDAIIPAEVSP